MSHPLHRQLVDFGVCANWDTNPQVVGSNPTPATKKLSRQDNFQRRPAFLQAAIFTLILR